MIKIIFIAGDGRSGSTLLETILSNDPGSIGVGECHRFWTRYSENRTICGCSKPIRECSLWSSVHAKLSEEFSNYDPEKFILEVQEFQRYKNFRQMPGLLKDERWSRFSEIITRFYELVADYSEKNTIIDSSKSMPWALLLQSIPAFDVRVIHLERNLSGVANSWKKQLLLPEYLEEKVYMPTKSSALIVKSWLKVRWLSRKVRSQEKYLFIRYEMLCANSEETLSSIMIFTGLRFDTTDLRIQSNHAIGGNPMRYNSDSAISIKNDSAEKTELSSLERFGFSLVDKLARFVGP